MPPSSSSPSQNPPNRIEAPIRDFYFCGDVEPSINLDFRRHDSPADSAGAGPPGCPSAVGLGLAGGNPAVFFRRRHGSQRLIAIAVDLSNESAYSVEWAVQNYLRPGDAVLYGADWDAVDLSVSESAAEEENSYSEASQQKLEDDFDAFTSAKAADLAKPFAEAQIPFEIHIVKDHDMKERLCLEVERFSLCAVIMGSRGFVASRRTNEGRLGSVSGYCIHHCVRPVVVVRYPDEGGGS